MVWFGTHQREQIGSLPGGHSASRQLVVFEQCGKVRLVLLLVTLSDVVLARICGNCMGTPFVRMQDSSRSSKTSRARTYAY